MFEDKLFISSTLPYINSEPHAGSCFEFVLTDVIARFYRLVLGDKNVMFNTGVDEHGNKVHQRAIELGKDPQEYCDEMAEKWLNFCDKLQISYDNFYRTTSTIHKERARRFLDEIKKDVYLKSYTALYCQGCESFKTEKDLVNGQCEQHPTLAIKEVSEENYFFKLKEFAQKYNCEDILFNPHLNNELKNIVANSEDISISRENVTWGIPVPDSFTKKQTIYVWQEALLSYIFAAGYNFQNTNEDFFDRTIKEFDAWWSNSMIVCGKDNLRFQALILPAILAANGIKAPKKVFVHGTILDENGDKMSKSTGNVIDPIEQLEKYGINALRYYLIAGMNSFDNSSYSEKELVTKFNNDVVNGYGNLMARTLHLINIKNVEIDDDFISEHDTIVNAVTEITNNVHTGNFKLAYANAAKLVAWGNKYITDEKPFAEECLNRTRVLNNVYFLLEQVSFVYQIAMPDMSDIIERALDNKRKIILFTKLEEPKSSVEQTN